LNLIIVSDAWAPQINGVVRTLEATIRELKQMGHSVCVLTPDPDRFWTFSVFFYPEIKLEFFAARRIATLFAAFRPDFVHIATEGPLGSAARSYCLRKGQAFTTSYHTRFPEYLSARAPRGFKKLVRSLSYARLRLFHKSAAAVMVATASLENDLRSHGFRNLVRWTRGVDTSVFVPQMSSPSPYKELPRPILLYVGRVAIEKNLCAYLDLKTSGSLIIVGDGPDLSALRLRYPHAHFLGTLTGKVLAEHYAAADLFVFPSETETFGLVLLEACAAGLRIASVHAPGPLDIFAAESAKTFCVMDNNLQTAVDRALSLPENPSAPRAFAALFSWQACTHDFVKILETHRHF
jgi:glycosyltransferase involved in cell wall biosynthesis